MDLNSIVTLVTLVISVASGIGVLYLNFRKAPFEIKHEGADAASSALDAADKALSLNKRYVDRIASLETRNDDLEQRVLKVESPQKYQIVVEFQTSTPPQVDKVSIVPCEVTSRSEGDFDYRNGKTKRSTP